MFYNAMVMAFLRALSYKETAYRKQYIHVYGQCFFTQIARLLKFYL